MSEAKRWEDIAWNWRIARLGVLLAVLTVGIVAGHRDWGNWAAGALFAAFLIVNGPLLYAYGRADSYRKIDETADVFGLPVDA